MLRGWPIALVAATGASGLFAFGLVQSAYATQALALFIVFGALLAMLMLSRRFFGGGGGHAAHGHGGGDHAVVMSGRMVGTATVLAAIAAVAYFWTDNQLSAEKIGRHIDRGAASLGQQAQLTFTRLTSGVVEQAAPEEQAQPAESELEG